MNKSRGFTLMELLVTLLIVSILASMAVPSFSGLIQTNRMSTHFNELLATLALARSEAVRRAAPVTVCKSNNSTACGGDWEDGWLVFIDTDSDGVVDTGEDIIRVHDALSGNTLNFSGDRVTYASSGLPTSTQGTFTLCDSRGNSKRKGLAVSPTGRVGHTFQV